MTFSGNTGLSDPKGNCDATIAAGTILEAVRAEEVRVTVDRIVNKATDFETAHRWDVQQHASMTPSERQQIARELRRRAYGDSNPDVREAERRP